jgi:group II intron reverse transcriptase/maturase
MKKSVLKQAMSAQNLNRAWRKLKRQHTPWSPTISRKDLDYNLLQHILELRENVLLGNYRPLPLRRYTIEKADGKKCIISAQYLQDKLFQRSLLQILEPRSEKIFHEDSFGYRPNLGVAKAMYRVRERVKCGQDWLVDADIQQFFDSIPHNQLKTLLTRFIKDKAVMRIINRWLKQGAHQQSFLGLRRGVSQGAVLSPLLCNLYLHELDKALTKANIPFVRFADDFLLFCTTRLEAEKALNFTTNELDKLGLTIHPKKTRVVRSHRGVIFLGERLPNPSR